MADNSNVKNNTNNLRNHNGWLITYNVFLAIFLSAGLVYIIAYTPLMPADKKELKELRESEMDFNDNLFDLVRKDRNNTRDTKKVFEDELHEFLRANRYEPSLSEKEFENKLHEFQERNPYVPSQPEIEVKKYKNKLLDFLRVNRALPVNSELEDSSNEETARFVFIYTLAAMFMGGAIGGILCNLCNTNLIDFLKDRYEPSQPKEEFEKILLSFLKNNTCDDPQSEIKLKIFKDALLKFLKENKKNLSSIELYLRPLKGAVTGLLAFFVGNLLVTSLSIDATQKGWETLRGRLPYVALAILSGYAAPEFMARLKKLAQTMFSETEKNKGQN